MQLSSRIWALGMIGAAGCQALSGLSGLEPGDTGTGAGAGGSGTTSSVGGATTAVGGASTSSSSTSSANGGAMVTTVGTGGSVEPVAMWEPLWADTLSCTGHCGVAAVDLRSNVGDPSLAFVSYFSQQLGGGGGGGPMSQGPLAFGALLHHADEVGDEPVLQGSFEPVDGSAGILPNQAVPTGVVQLSNGTIAVAVNVLGQFLDPDGNTNTSTGAAVPTWDAWIWLRDVGGSNTYIKITADGPARLAGLRPNAAGDAFIAYGEQPGSAQLTDTSGNPLSPFGAGAGTHGFAFVVSQTGVIPGARWELLGSGEKAIRGAAFAADGTLTFCADVQGVWQLQPSSSTDGQLNDEVLILRVNSGGAVWREEVVASAGDAGTVRCNGLDVGPSGDVTLTLGQEGVIDFPADDSGSVATEAADPGYSQIVNLLLSTDGHYLGHGTMGHSDLGAGLGVFDALYTNTAIPRAANVITDFGEVFVGSANVEIDGGLTSNFDAYFLSFTGDRADRVMAKLGGAVNTNQAFLATASNHATQPLLAIGGSFEGQVTLPNGATAMATNHDAMIVVYEPPPPVN